MHNIIFQSLFEPLKEERIFKKVLPSLLIQGFALSVVLLQSQMFLKYLDSLVSDIRDPEKSNDDLLISGVICLFSLAFFKASSICFSQNNQKNAALFSWEVFLFHCEQLEQDEDFNEALLKKNKKNTKDLIISGSDIVLNLSLVGGALYRASGLSRHMALAYCLMRCFSSVAQAPERLPGLPFTQHDIVNETSVTQCRQGFFHLTQQATSAYSNLSSSARAGLSMALGAILSGLQAPEYLALSVQVCGAVEWACEHLLAFKKAQAEMSERFNPS